MAIPRNILRRYQGEIDKVLALDYESFWALASALRDAPLKLVPDNLAPELALRVEAIPPSDLEDIVRTLLTLCTLRDQIGAPISEVAEDVSRSVEGASDEDRERIKDRFIELLDLDSLNVIAKSGSLMLNHERWMLRVQILTDIRPVFGPKPKDPPRAAVIAHTLKLTYFEDGENREYFIAMDANDLRDLSEQVERANEKTESLQSVLAAAGVPYVDDKRKLGKEGSNDAGREEH